MKHDTYKTVDRMQSALAKTHHIQTRIAQTLAKGTLNAGVAKEVAEMARDIGDDFLRASEGK